MNVLCSDVIDKCFFKITSTLNDYYFYYYCHYKYWNKVAGDWLILDIIHSTALRSGKSGYINALKNDIL